MNHAKLFFRFPALFLPILGFALAVPAQAQQAETEPNNACAAAQNLSAATFPFTVAGSLDMPSDVDFYRFTGTPGDGLTISHRGSGATPLSDPYLGVFDGDCWTLLATNDDSGGTYDSQLSFTVPASGAFVVAATSFGDYYFTGGGYATGSYTLSLERLAVAQGVTGRLVNARTGAPVQAYVYLSRCSGDDCHGVGYAYTGSNGDFRFDASSYLYGGPLVAGDYKIVAQPTNYYRLETAPFHLAEGALVDLGDLAISPIPAVSSIRGRAVDSFTGAPLPGTTVPRAWVDLLSCNPEYGPSSCSTIRGVRPDAQGVFRFEGSDNYPLRAGTYRVRIWADQYQMTDEEFVVTGDTDNVDIGDVGLKSFPVRIHLTQSCGAIPAAGGDCNFTVTLSNGLETKLQGEVWSVVQAYGLGSIVQSTVFQTDAPKSLNLAAGTSAVLPFSFFVPAEVPNGAYICARAVAAHKPHAFNTLGAHDLFCLWKGAQGFTLVPEEQKRDAVKAAKGEDKQTPTP